MASYPLFEINFKNDTGSDGGLEYCTALTIHLIMYSMRVFFYSIAQTQARIFFTLVILCQNSILVINFEIPDLTL